jgi:hypothetical protein
MRFSLDVSVEKRRVRDHGKVTFDLAFPPSARNAEHCQSWARNSGWDIAQNRPGRVPGPVRIMLEYEERTARRISQDMIDPVLMLLEKFSIIDSLHRSCIREVSGKWATVQGCRVTIEPAVSVQRAAA